MFELTLGSCDAASFGLVFALEELRANYTLRVLDLPALEQWGPTHRKQSPSGAVPLLRHNELPLAESDLALDYLAQHYKQLGFSDPAAHYRCQKLLFQLRDSLGENANLAGWAITQSRAEQTDYRQRLNTIEGRPRLSGWTAVWRDAVPMEERPTAALAKLVEGIMLISQTLGDKQWLVGEHFSIADVAAYAGLRDIGTLLPSGQRPEDNPRIATWMTQVAARQACTAAHRKLIKQQINMRFPPPQD